MIAAGDDGAQTDREAPGFDGALSLGAPAFECSSGGWRMVGGGSSG